MTTTNEKPKSYASKCKNCGDRPTYTMRYLYEGPELTIYRGVEHSLVCDYCKEKVAAESMEQAILDWNALQDG